MNTKTLSQTCHFLGCTNKQLDRLLIDAGIDKSMLPTISTDKRKRLLTNEQVEQIRAMLPLAAFTESTETERTILERLATLERLVRELQSEKQSAKRSFAHKPTSIPTPSQPKRNEQAHSTLPEGYISAFTWAEKHHIPTTTVRGACKDGRLPIIKGPWKFSRNWIKEAIDSEGQQAAYNLWHERPDFHTCADCPKSHQQ